MFFTPYFTQTEYWSKFWKIANPVQHDVIKLEVNSTNVTVYAFVYIYPWVGGQKFMYIPRGPVIQLTNPNNKQTSESESVNTNASLEVSRFINPNSIKAINLFWEKLIHYAQQTNSVYVKIDMDHFTSRVLGLNHPDDLRNYLASKLSQSVRVSNKSIQYLSTIFLDLENLKTPFQLGFDHTHNDHLKLFFESNRTFWLARNKSIRNSTRRALKHGWEISNLKNQENVEAFWILHTQTSKRQQIGTYHQEYFQKLIEQDFAHLITLSKAGKPQATWLGIQSGDSLIHLFGGNSTESLRNFGQHLLHLSAIGLATKLNLKSYDFGGYDPNKGYGKFKQAYHGQIIDFPGTVDIILSPNKYQLIQLLIKIVKVFTR